MFGDHPWHNKHAFGTDSRRNLRNRCGNLLADDLRRPCLHIDPGHRGSSRYRRRRKGVHQMELR